MKFIELINKGITLLDGGMGSLLQSRGLRVGELPELWCLTHPEVVEQIHYEYITAGADIIVTNTFGANILKMEEDELRAVITAAVTCAKSAVKRSGADCLVALDIGPTGRMLKPLGDLDFERAVEVFTLTARLGAEAGCDLIFIETMGDIYEAKAALLAAKEATSLPVCVSCAFGSDGRLFTGATPEVVATVLSSLGADMIGANCSVGPDDMLSVLARLVEYSTVPVFAKPNAGMPRIEGGRTSYGVSPKDFASAVGRLIGAGAVMVGGCCGTTPEYIRELKNTLAGVERPTPVLKKRTVVCSYSSVVEIGRDPVLIGERINPTGKKRFKEALRTEDYGYILREAITEEEDGAHILDVNVGLPEVDESAVLTRAVTELQTVTALPLCIDTSNPVAMESALRRYNGKPLINSVNGKEESLREILPIAKKYGGVIICLTLDENGIPKTAQKRLEIAKRIISAARDYGISESELVFDPLCLAIGADSSAAGELILTLQKFAELGLKTSLGVSNVSFGLPEREIINSTFFAMALTAGLNAAIINPHSRAMMDVYYSFRALSGMDVSCSEYVAYATGNSNSPDPVCDKSEITLSYAIKKGMRDKASKLTSALLSEKEPLDIIDGEIIPALNEVGLSYERGESYLPTLLMSAEAAASAFEVIKSKMNGSAAGKCTVLLATVEGDIHDIGKNIVRLLLENYGFEVVDLGRDVPPEKILLAAKERNAALVGLSALMTTTLPAMERTVRLLKENLTSVRVIVGGAVLTEEYAAMIGADAYSSDALGAVRYAEAIDSSLKEV